MSFFEEEYECFEEEYCTHEIIIDNHHCAICGEILETLILPDDINMEDNPVSKKIVVDHSNLLNIIKDLDISKTCKDILMEEVEKISLKIKSNKDSANKLIFLYGYKYLIYPDILYISPDRWAKMCNVTVNSQLVKLIDTCCEDIKKIKIIKPDIYIKEFLESLDKEQYKDIINKITNFCHYIIKRKNITSSYEVFPNTINEGRTGLDKYPVLQGDIDHNKLSIDEMEDRIESLNEDFLEGKDINIEEKETVFDLPQKIAATTLFCALNMDTKNVSSIDIKGKISAVSAGEPDDLPYEEKDICEYFSVSPKTLLTMSSDFGIKKMKVRSRKNNLRITGRVSSRR